MISQKLLKQYAKDSKKALAIKWYDASSDPSWTRPDDVSDERYEVWSLGFPVKLVKHYLTVAQNWADNGKVSCTMSIPVSTILEVLQLDENRPRSKRGKK